MDITFPFVWVCLGLQLEPTGLEASEADPRRGPGHPCSGSMLSHQHCILSHWESHGMCWYHGECLPRLSSPVSSTNPRAQAGHHLCWDFNPGSQTEQQSDRLSAPLHSPGLIKGGSVPASAAWKLLPPLFLCCDSRTQHILDHDQGHFSVPFPGRQHSTTGAPSPHSSPMMGGRFPCAQGDSGSRFCGLARVICGCGTMLCQELTSPEQ